MSSNGETSDKTSKLEEDIIYDGYDDFAINMGKNKARGGGKSRNNTKKDAKHNKNKSCYNSKHIRKVENKTNG
jgi:hypothetical protein